MTSQDQIFGHAGERWAFDQLVDRGYHPRFDPDFYAPGRDIVVDGLPVEVKIARPTQQPVRGKFRKRWQWFIHPTTHQIGEYALILIAEDSTGKRHAYIVPGSAVGTRTQIQLTSHPDKYRGWIAKFKNRWDTIEYLAREVYANQGPLFDEWGGRVAA